MGARFEEAARLLVENRITGTGKTVTFNLMPDRTFGDPPFMVKASQPGNATYLAALPVERTFTVAPARIVLPVAVKDVPLN